VVFIKKCLTDKGAV